MGLGIPSDVEIDSTYAHRGEEDFHAERPAQAKVQARIGFVLRNHLHARLVPGEGGE